MSRSHTVPRHLIPLSEHMTRTGSAGSKGTSPTDKDQGEEADEKEEKEEEEDTGREPTAV